MATRFLLLAATTLLLLVSLSPTPTTCKLSIPEPVLDMSGNPVEYGAEYYVIPIEGSMGGGLTRASRPHSPRCPLYAVQSPDNRDKGAAIKFVAVESDPSNTNVLIRTDLRINSGVSGSCLSRGFWKVKQDRPTGRHEIVAAGERSISPASFQLEPTRSSPLPAYWISHCLDCTEQVQVHYLLFVIQDNTSGMRMLGIPAGNDVSRDLQVVFVKKTEADAAAFEY